jgi:hypothetical protein
LASWALPIEHPKDEGIHLARLGPHACNNQSIDVVLVVNYQDEAGYSHHTTLHHHAFPPTFALGEGIVGYLLPSLGYNFHNLRIRHVVGLAASEPTKAANQREPRSKAYWPSRFR